MFNVGPELNQHMFNILCFLCRHSVQYTYVTETVMLRSALLHSNNISQEEITLLHEVEMLTSVILGQRIYFLRDV